MTDQRDNAITRDCPIACLASLLTRSTLEALIAGIEGEPATVRQVIELYEQHRLRDIYGISSGRTGEIRWALVHAGLLEPNSAPLASQAIRDGVRKAHHRHED